MSTTATQVETAHDDMIHDAQLDYYGKRLATCSSDRSVRIFDVVEGQQQTASRTPGSVLKGHSGPVWQVAWAHPKFGHILASCSYDGKVFVWKEETGPHGGWVKTKEHALHSASVNSVSWAPHELGAILACASSDGKISILTFKMDNTSQADIFTAHSIGANSVSWAPATPPGSLITPNPPTAGPQGAPSQPQPLPLVKRFVSGGCDNLVKIWAYNDATASWAPETTLEAHVDWVRDVAWAPNIGLPRSYIASCSQDRTVYIWTKDSATAPWQKTQLDGGGPDKKFPDTVWRVSWSLSGNILAVSCGDGKVTLWKEVVSTAGVGKAKETWECITDMTS